MRGKVQRKAETGLECGITPAYAGKSGGCLRRLGGCKDHPRICGEKDSFLDDSLDVEGSPPHMRGKA